MVFLIDDILIGLAISKSFYNTRKSRAEALEAEEYLRLLRAREPGSYNSQYGISFSTSINGVDVSLTAEDYVKHVNAVKEELQLYKEVADKAMSTLNNITNVFDQIHAPYTEAIVNFITDAGKEIDIRKDIPVLVGGKIATAELCTIRLRCVETGIEVDDVGAGFLPISSSMRFVAHGSSPSDLVRSTISWRVLHKDLPKNNKYWGSVSYPIAMMLAYITGVELSGTTFYIADNWHYLDHVGRNWTFKTNLSTNVSAIYIG